VTGETLKFICFALFSAFMLVAANTARRRRWVDEDWSRPLHLHTVVWIWSPVSIISFWNLKLEPQVITLMVLQPLTMLAGWGLVVLFAKARRMNRDETGVLTLCAALSNQGFTLGAYLCYVLFRPATDAMSYAIAFVTSMQVFMVVIFYPVARHYGPEPNQRIWRLVVGSFLDIRAAPLYAAVAGLILNVLDQPVPGWIETTPVLDVMFFIGAVGSYGGIGLRLRLGDVARYLPHHLGLAAVKFLGMPALALAALFLLDAVGLGLSELAAKVIVVSCFMPSAIASVITPNLFHLDARMASVLWLTNTALFCAVPLPLLLWYFA